MLRHGSKAITDRTYRPYPTRQVEIAKSGGGTRELRIAGFVDRVVNAAVYLAIRDCCDTHLLPGCHGFRPSRSILRMLADMALTMQAENRYWVATEDIKNAFPSVPVADAVADYSQIVADEGVLWLIERVLRGAEGQARTVGIDQGNALSPLTLNLRLSNCLDRPFTADPGMPPWYRWADDLAYLCRGVTECHQAIGQAAEMLRPAGFSLKGTAGRPVNLKRQGARVEILGYEVSFKDGWFLLHIPTSAWTRFRQELEQAYAGERPCQLAAVSIRGWLGHYGVAVGGEEVQRVARRVMDLAAELGFRELGSIHEVIRCIRQFQKRGGVEWRKAIDRRSLGCNSAALRARIDTPENGRGPASPSLDGPPVSLTSAT